MPIDPSNISRLSRFTHELRRLNNYPTNTQWEWLFLPGMKFGDTIKWWGAGGERARPHEGLDFLILLDESGGRHLLPAGTLIPPVLNGIEVARIADFLGETVILAHDLLDDAGRRLHTFYAHLQPTGTQTGGKTMVTDSQIGQIADPTKTTITCPPHLHLSLAWVEKSYPLRDFHWTDYFNSENYRPDDPLALLQLQI